MLKRNFLICLSFFIAFNICYVPGILASTLIIPALEARSGSYIEVPLLIDEADNLAGIKLTIRYDDKILQYEDARQSEYTEPLMHVINDKRPGRLIVVMAGAEGVKGTDVPLIFISFRVKNGLKEKNSLSMEISNIQLVNDQLKSLESDSRVEPLIVLPELDKSLENQ